MSASISASASGETEIGGTTSISFDKVPPYPTCPKYGTSMSKRQASLERIPSRLDMDPRARKSKKMRPISDQRVFECNVAM